LFLVDKSLTLNTTDTSGFKFTNLHSASIVSNINNYVAKKTHNLIKGTISEPYDDSVKAVVLDTIYFKGTWQKQFSANATYEDTFYGVTGDEQTKFMHQTSKFDYYANDDFAMIEMGYTNSDLAMDVAVIDNYSSKKDILSAYDFIAKNVSKLETKKVTLSMPKFEIDADLNIINAYKYAGINNLFSASADLSKLADDIYISDVIQKAKIIVDEEGTEAAAVTMMMAELSSALTEPEEIIEMNINKPFVYVIRDTSTNTILFTGYKLNF
jgi:serpin B